MNLFLKVNVFVVAVLFLISCGEKNPPKVTQKSDEALETLNEEAPKEVLINGAGATFPYPVYSQWAYAYHKESGAKLNYQSIGSGGGIAQIKAKAVDFGASDAPLKAHYLDTLGLVQFPMVMGGVVPVINVEGVEPGALKLTSELLADIFLGKITVWNDKRIKDSNPRLTLPNQAIAVVHRADGSGTTWIFTNYLDKISTQWHEKVGTDKAVDWPVGMGGKGNEGVAAYVQRIKGSIGYVEYAYAVQNKMTHVKLLNKSGHFVDPTSESFQAAAANANWVGTPGFYIVLTDQPGEKSWPITGATFILMHQKQEHPDIAKAALKFFDWCYKHGASKARKLHYVPMPEAVVNVVRKIWRDKITSKDGDPVWK